MSVRLETGPAGEEHPTRVSIAAARLANAQFLQPAAAATGAAFEVGHTRKGQMLGLHMPEIGRSFFGPDDPHVQAVQKALGDLMRSTNSQGNQYSAPNPPKHTKFVTKDGVTYYITAETSRASQQGEINQVQIRVFARMTDASGKSIGSVVLPIYASAFKTWASYDSPWALRY